MILPEKNILKTKINKFGKEIKSLYIKNFELEDWDAIRKIQIENNMGSVADAIRFAIRRTAGRL